MEDFFENELAKKFEDMLENGEELYFDTEELEEIIIHYLELGDITYAEKAVTFGLKLHPDSIDIKTKQLEVFLELENYTQAKKIITELQECSMEDTDFLVCCAKYYSNLGNPKRAIGYCKKALLLKEEENFLHNFIADEYVNLGDPFSALGHYRHALEAEPSDDYALENIMTCYHQQNKHKEAIDFLNDYLDHYPYSEIAWFEYGQYYFNRKNYEEAIKGYDFLLAIDSAAVNVYANKAACYEAMKEWQKAIDVYLEVLELEYTKAYTFYKIGLCYKELKQNVAALSCFQKSLKEDPQFYQSMMEQSYIYEDLGGKSEALHFAKEATAHNDSNLEYHKRLAFLHIDSGNFEESLISLKKLVDTEPNHFYHWYAYTEVLMLLGEYEDAATIIQSALKKHKRAELFYQLSNCFYNLKDDLKGKEILDFAISIDASLRTDMEAKYPFLKEPPKKNQKGRTK